MLIQRRRLADRAKRRAEMLAQRARGEEEPAHSSSTGAVDIDESEIDLDAISAQSASGPLNSDAYRPAIGNCTVVEIHSAFGFWRIFAVGCHLYGAGVESTGRYSGAVLIAILVFIITARLVRNLPALLELALLQHLSI